MTARGAGWLAFAAVLALAGVLACSRWSQVERFGSVDFYDYYYAASGVLAGHDPFDGAWIEARAAAAGVPFIAGSDYIYPAWFAVLLVPLVPLGPRVAAGLWFVVSAAFLAYVVARTREGAPKWWPIAATAFVPTLFTLFVGQVNLLLVAALAFAWQRRADRPRLAGGALGLAIALKLSPVLLVAPFFVERRWRALSAAAATMVACAGVGELATPGSTGAFALRVLPSLTQASARHAHPVNQGLFGMYARALIPTEWTQPIRHAPHLVRPLAVATGLLLLLVTAVVLIRGREASPPGQSTGDRAFAALCALLAVLSPLAWESFHVVLLLPAAWLLRGVRSGSTRWLLGTACLLECGQRLFSWYATTSQLAGAPLATTVLCSLATLGAILVWIACLSARTRGDAQGTSTT